MQTRLVRFLAFRPLGAVARVHVADDAQVEGMIWVTGSGEVHIGRGARLLGRRAPIELCAHAGARIWIGEGVVIEGGASIEATTSVHVGNGVRIEAFSKIIDNHFHPTTGDRFRRPAGVPIVIGDEAHVGLRAILLPGASLGERARVAPRRVVSFPVPAERAA
jgi:acetyltransferase-like isoleucine patch superfamily enzyme